MARRLKRQVRARVAGPQLPVEGTLARYDAHTWFVGLVCERRTRLDSITATAVRTDPRGGHVRIGWADPVSLDPHMKLEQVDVSTLDDAGLLRYSRLLDAWRAEVPRRTHTHHLVDLEEDDMAEMAGAPVGGQSLKEKNAARLQALKDKKASAPAAPAAAKAGPKLAKGATAAAPVKEKAPRVKKERELNECLCGCGGTTGGVFVPGHDARFKGWLLQIERGKAQPADLMPAEVVAKFKWIKRGIGKIPTTNYRGEPHTGYLAEPVTQ